MIMRRQSQPPSSIRPVPTTTPRRQRRASAESPRSPPFFVQRRPASSRSAESLLEDDTYHFTPCSDTLQPLDNNDDDDKSLNSKASPDASAVATTMQNAVVAAGELPSPQPPVTNGTHSDLEDPNFSAAVAIGLALQEETSSGSFLSQASRDSILERAQQSMRQHYGQHPPHTLLPRPSEPSPMNAIDTAPWVRSPGRIAPRISRRFPRPEQRLPDVRTGRLVRPPGPGGNRQESILSRDSYRRPCGACEADLSVPKAAILLQCPRCGAVGPAAMHVVVDGVDDGGSVNLVL